MSKNKLPIEVFSKLLDLFGEEIAGELLDKANEGKIDPKVLEDGLFSGETKAEYIERIRRE